MNDLLENSQKNINILYAITKLCNCLRHVYVVSIYSGITHENKKVILNQIFSYFCQIICLVYIVTSHL
jgi:hypothetical protein